jgi:hypothetical protein
MQEISRSAAPNTGNIAQFGPSADDLVIIPLAVNAAAVKQLLRAALIGLVRILDGAFPILLQLARFPLFTVRIVGDGIAAVLKGAIALLPLSAANRETWRAWVAGHWAALRAKISYRAFEEWIHHAFEDGMTWVFRTCGKLTPRNALLVICAAMMWLPISFGAATTVHIVLLAKAASLPPWMQLFHPVAAFIAKSKLLTLPVYPAAWPQAKQHPFVQAMSRAWQRFAALHLVRKTAYRFRQAEEVLLALTAAAGQQLARLLPEDIAQRTGLVSIWRLVHASTLRAIDGLSNLPLISVIRRRYAAHYDEVGLEPVPLSERTRALFQRWSIKFSAEYYVKRQELVVPEVSSNVRR